MNRFDDYLLLVGYDIDQQYPKIDYVWYAYKNGEVFKCDTESDAKKISSNVEKVQTKESKHIFDQYCTNQRELYSKATQLWYNDLVEQFSHIPKPVVDIAYSYAYDRSHSGGHDEIYNSIHEYIEFYEKLVTLRINNE